MLKGKKLNLKRESKHQNQNKIWLFGIIRLVIKITMINLLRDLVEKVKYNVIQCKNTM